MPKKLPASSANESDDGHVQVMTDETRDFAALEEYWHTADKFDPLQKQDPMESRYEQGKALRERTPRESHNPNYLKGVPPT